MMKHQFSRERYMVLGAAIILVLITFISCSDYTKINPQGSDHDLYFTQLAQSWDEGIPLGNGIMGALVWEKEGKLRFSLDRADLWDLRPMDNLDKPEWKFNWVKKQWENKTYDRVQELFDAPYDRNPAPSKIPAGAMEFNIEVLGDVESVQLYLNNALCEVQWENGARLMTFIQAEGPVGWFRFEGVDDEMIPELIAPAYNLEGEAGKSDPVSGQDLRRLGYPKGNISKEGKSITYTQKGWGGFEYQVNVHWRKGNKVTEGCWSISSEFPGWEKQIAAKNLTAVAIKNGFIHQLENHKKWWKEFWNQSSIAVPDSVLQKQWYLEMYKLGAATGNGAPPISLQAVWTADNGKLPPWKGDFHHDLNTQLSYWSAYSSNHLKEEQGFIDWMWKNKPAFEYYTKQYYETSGLNVPGVTTHTGQPMGGWIQYSFGPTVSAWLGQSFYWHWRYSMDRDFLEHKAWPWLQAVAIHLDELSVKDENGMRKLPISSSPEIFNNSREAWFSNTTNFDLGLIRWTFEKTAELAKELGRNKEAKKWLNILSQWPQPDVDPESGLTFATGFPYDASHRHFSHLMAFHPMGIIDWSNGEDHQEIIKNTINTLDKYGGDWWTGYSYSWLGNLKARAFDGKGAAEALKTFATCFCSPNSFHLNGDQSGTGKSKFTYRPFTLEGNFAFAAGIQEMLLQSHTDVIRIFPAIPNDWKDVSFNQLRAQGAFLISAEMKNGKVTHVVITAIKGGELVLENPFDGAFVIEGEDYQMTEQRIVISTTFGQKVILRNIQ